MEDVEAASSEEVRNLEPPSGKRALKEGKARYYNRQQQLELVLAAQEQTKHGEHEVGDTRSGEEETSDVDVANTDIWVDEICLGLLKEGILQTQWILRQERGPRKEQPTIAGMKGSYTLGGCMCPNQRRGWGL